MRFTNSTQAMAPVSSLKPGDKLVHVIIKNELINKGISMENLHGYDRILIISQTFRRYLSHLLIFCSSELRYKLKKVISFSADG